MIRTSHMLKQRAFFSTTSTRGSILDYFRKKSADVPATPATKDVISNIESGNIETKARIPIIGKKNEARENRWKERMNGFTVEHWIPSAPLYKQMITSENLEHKKQVIDELLLKTYNEVHSSPLQSIDASHELSDLQNRFKLVKQLQVAFGVLISDYEMTKLKDFAKLREFMHKQLLNPKKFNEKEPNAIYLNKEEFKGTNVTISDFVGESKKKKNFKNLLKEAKRLEKLETEKLLQQHSNA